MGPTVAAKVLVSLDRDGLWSNRSPAVSVHLSPAGRGELPMPLHFNLISAEGSYLIVTSTRTSAVPEVVSFLPVAVIAKVSAPLYRAFAVYW